MADLRGPILREGEGGEGEEKKREGSWEGKGRGKEEGNVVSWLGGGRPCLLLNRSPLIPYVGYGQVLDALWWPIPPNYWNPGPPSWFCAMCIYYKFCMTSNNLLRYTYELVNWLEIRSKKSKHRHVCRTVKYCTIGLFQSAESTLYYMFMISYNGYKNVENICRNGSSTFQSTNYVYKCAQLILVCVKGSAVLWRCSASASRCR